jgi:hypothetical protein
MRGWRTLFDNLKARDKGTCHPFYRGETKFHHSFDARVAKLADAPDLGSGGETREGSTPSPRTIQLLKGGKQSLPRELRRMAQYPFSNEKGVRTI